MLDLDQPEASCTIAALRELRTVAALPILALASVDQRPKRASMPPGPTELVSSPPRHSALRRAFARLLRLEGTELSELYRTGETRLAAIPTGQGRLLVIEDNPTARLIAQRFLERLGYEVLVAADGVAGLEALEQPFDLILMDCQLPRTTGYALTRTIREGDGPNRDTPILAVTAHAQGDERQRCLDSGMNECVVKPYEPEELAAEVARLLGLDQRPGTT